MARFGARHESGTLRTAIAIAALALVGVAVSRDARAQEPPLCRNKAATIVGTPGPDRLSGTSERDVIAAGAGGDIVDGLAGRDLICGDAGDDVLFGGTGSDPLFGGAGADLLHGNRGNDRVNGGDGDRDQVFGDLGDDLVRGGAGVFDEAAGGLGIDVVNGGPGDGDLVSGDYGYDVMIGGAGAADVASFATEVPDRFGTGIEASLVSGRGDGRRQRRPAPLRGPEGLRLRRPPGRRPELQRDRRRPGRRPAARRRRPRRRARGPGSGPLPGFATAAACGPARAISAAGVRDVDVSPAGGGDFVVLPAEGRRRPAQGRLRQGSRAPSAHLPAPDRDRRWLRGRPATAVGGLLPGRAARPAASSPTSAPATTGSSVAGDLLGVGQVRVTGGAGDDSCSAAPRTTCSRPAPGRTSCSGGGGSDGLIGGIPGADVLIGGPGGDLISAGGACIGGALIGGAGRDNASFAETLGHPGVLYASLAAGIAKVDAIPGCRPVRLHSSLEDLEGSFDWDILIGDAGANNLLGQPGQDRFFGRGGDDVLSADDEEADFVISCGGGPDELFADPQDPPGRSC